MQIAIAQTKKPVKPQDADQAVDIPVDQGNGDDGFGVLGLVGGGFSDALEMAPVGRRGAAALGVLSIASVVPAPLPIFPPLGLPAPLPFSPPLGLPSPVGIQPGPIAGQPNILASIQSGNSLAGGGALPTAALTVRKYSYYRINDVFQYYK